MHRPRQPTRTHTRLRVSTGLACLLVLTGGCQAEALAIMYFALGTGLGAWLLGRETRHRALSAAENLRYAIANGRQRDIEYQLKRQLALVAAGEAVNYEREWLARAQLGGLLVAEWRLDEAREIYDGQREDLPPHLGALANFGRHELAVLTRTPDQALLDAIRADRGACIELAPPRYRTLMEQTWNALEGLCLVRMGRAREAIPLLSGGLDSLAYSPARVVYLYHLGQAYEHIGEHQLAGEQYQNASQAFPGTRLANEAKTRVMALGPGRGGGDGLFRQMLPEAPAPQTVYPNDPNAPSAPRALNPSPTSDASDSKSSREPEKGSPAPSQPSSPSRTKPGPDDDGPAGA